MDPNPRAGQPSSSAPLENIPKLVTAYFAEVPDPSVPEQRVRFGTSGHRGSSLDGTFNERHILAITQAICQQRRAAGAGGPLFMGMDTHALSEPALVSALEVLAANGVDVMLAVDDEYTPTPAVSHAILTYNRGRAGGLADGIVITPSHNPPGDGGFKYDPASGGPADTTVTAAIEEHANALLADGLRGIRRMPYARARAAATTHRHDYRSAYVADLRDVVDLEAVRDAGVRLGVDPLGGAGVRYWPAIADRYGIDLEVVHDEVDPTFRFMPPDRDGRIRTDPSSPYAMRRVAALQDRFDVAFAADADHDRHGIVAHSSGLMPPNDYLATAIAYLFRHRPGWAPETAVGKTAVSSALIDRVAAQLGRGLYEVPVGFKWFVPGLLDGSIGFGGEESAGASFLRLRGEVWTTDKDGITPGLLAAEMTARTGRDPGELYRDLTRDLGEPTYDRIDAPATAEQREALGRLSADDVQVAELAGEPVEAVLTAAPGNGAALGGVKVVAATGWFAARPSGTESIYKVYAESFRGPEALRRIQAQAQQVVDAALRKSHASRG